MLTAHEIETWSRRDSNVVILDDERRRRRPTQAQRDARTWIDGWFHLWAMPAQIWLSYVRELHTHARPGARG